MIEIRCLAKVFVVHDDKILLIKRSLTDPRRPGQWDIPGGHTDADEFAEEAAARETLEEAGIAVDARQLVLVATRSEVVSNDLIAHWLFYTATTDQQTVTISDEHDEFAWVATSEALKLITYDIQHQALIDALRTGRLPA